MGLPIMQMFVKPAGRFTTYRHRFARVAPIQNFIFYENSTLNSNLTTLKFDFVAYFGRVPLYMHQSISVRAAQSRAKMHS